MHSEIANLNYSVRIAVSNIIKYIHTNKSIWSNDDLHKKRKSKLEEIINQFGREYNEDYCADNLKKESIQKRIDYVANFIDDDTLGKHHWLSTKEKDADTTAITLLKTLNDITSKLLTVQTEYDNKLAELRSEKPYHKINH